MIGEQWIPQTQALTWQALNDTQILKLCINGCESITPTAANEFELIMTAKVGPVSAKFKGKMILSDIVEPTSYSISFEGQGGIAGFAKGTAHVQLSPKEEGTLLTYRAQAMVGGKLAQIGSRLIDGVAKKIANDFFKAFNAKVSAG